MGVNKSGVKDQGGTGSGMAGVWLLISVE
jgi:hypothetical protein